MILLVSKLWKLKARTRRTACVNGKSSAKGRMNLGRSAMGKTTPEKKNMGEITPVKKKLKWFIFFTKEVIHRDRAPNIIPVINPIIGVSKIIFRGNIPKMRMIIKTQSEKNNPLVPTQKISPINKFDAVIGVPSIPS